MPVRPRMEVEIHVRRQVLALEVFVRTTADIVGVIEQFRNAGETAHELEELRRVKHGIETAVGRA